MSKFSPEAIQAMLDASESNSEIVLLGQTIGAASLLTVLEILGGPRGCEIYVPSPHRLVLRLSREFRNKDICQHYRDGEAHIWAKKYNISEDRVRKIVNANAKEALWNQ